MSLQKKIKDLSETYFNEVVTIRRTIHQNPELSFQELQTSAYIKSILTEKKIPFEEIANTGIVATIEATSAKDLTVGIRAELDALPIYEKNNISYKSKNEGVMHACGHDVHMASILGTTFILNDLKEHLNCTVKVIFQPGEEKLPGGASILLKEGLLSKHRIQYMIAQHVAPQIEAGKVGFRPGTYMASCDEIYLTIQGKGGHGALPHTVVDPVPIAAQIITALQQLVSRNNNPTTPSVLSFGKVIADGATNVIPDEVHLEGTFRTFDEKWRKEAHHKIKDICQNIAKAFGANAELKIDIGYPFLHNNEELTQKCKTFSQEFLGTDNVMDLDLRMTSEDFAFYSQKIPVCFYRLGVRNEKGGIVSPVHSSTFNIDEQVFKHSTGLMAWMVVSLKD